MSLISYSVFNHPFVSNLRLELRKLRQANGRYEYIAKKQKQKNQELSDKVSERDLENKRLKRALEESEKNNQELKNEIGLLKGQNEKLAENVHTLAEILFARKDRSKEKIDKKIGGQPGHVGYGRKSPERIDVEQIVFLNVCPDCGEPLNRGKHIKFHTVEDIPELMLTKTTVTRYAIDEQYCNICEKHVRAVPENVIPGSRLGLNLALLLIVLRTVSDQTLYQICDDVNIIFGTNISAGGAEQILHRAREYLGSTYDGILKQIQQSKVKHADETSWKINGATHWNWVFATTNAIYHTIRNTRGKGIPQEVIGGANCNINSVLVSDDYRGYNNLNCSRQRCWAHLTNVVREKLKLYPDSNELKTVQDVLGALFGLLSKTIKEPFVKTKRLKIHTQAWKIIKNIINTEYSCPAAKKVQTRIKNEGKELLTALLYDGVPLTNNLAERAIRPMVIFRKITGGSRSSDGAKTTAVLRSVAQTIRARKQPLIETLKEELLKGILARRTQVA